MPFRYFATSFTGISISLHWSIIVNRVERLWSPSYSVVAYFVHLKVHNVQLHPYHFHLSDQFINSFPRNLWAKNTVRELYICTSSIWRIEMWRVWFREVRDSRSFGLRLVKRDCQGQGAAPVLFLNTHCSSNVRVLAPCCQGQRERFGLLAGAKYACC